MKFLAFTLVLTTSTILLLVAATDEKPSQNNFSWGTRGPQDVLLFRDTVEVEGKWLRISQMDLHYPRPFQFGDLITAIDVYDRAAKGEGGYGKIKSGGINKHHVSLRFKSQRGKGMNFTVEIYGRKK